MPTEEELEQHLYDFILEQQSEVRNVLDLLGDEYQTQTKHSKTEQNIAKGGEGK